MQIGRSFFCYKHATHHPIFFVTLMVSNINRGGLHTPPPFYDMFPLHDMIHGRRSPSLCGFIPVKLLNQGATFFANPSTD